MTNTKQLADRIVQALKTQLRAFDLPAFKSIYIAGSYCRGDWLNSSSDLDVHMINNDTEQEHKEANYERIRSIVSNALNGHVFPSHCPGGIDYGFSNLSNIPKTTEEARKPSPYSNFSALMFDFKQNNITIYGEDINNLLPEAPDPKTCARQWFDMLVTRIENTKPDDIRFPFGVYKAIIAVQILFGERTVNKYKLLELYQKYVPDFTEKYFGELVIRNYLGSIYPDRTPVVLQNSEYLSFMHGLSNMVINKYIE